MNEDHMATQAAKIRPTVKTTAHALNPFQESHSKFKVLRRVTNADAGEETQHEFTSAEDPKTLFILDSSFNPPSVAHKSMVLSALHKSNSDKFPKPHGLLLLFATMNADKAPSAAPFEQRLTLMAIFASDLIANLRQAAEDHSVVPVDIGVTKVPYYTDKSGAIESDGAEWYTAKPKHIHLVGFDTLTRFFAAKYYQKFNPPFSALDPYFDAGHRLRVTLRPDDEYGTVEEQRAFVQRLEDGEMEKDGGKREWAKQVELVGPNPKTGVSSTRVRKAAKREDWTELADLCTPSVAEWVRSEELYGEDDRGAKMA